MEYITWFAPILPGKTEAWEAFAAEMAGARREDHERSRRRIGLHREVASLMSTPQGDFVALYHEADDLARMFREFAGSQDPHDVWFRDNMVEFHGLTPEMLQGPPPARLVLDYNEETWARQGVGRGEGRSESRGGATSSDTE
ncbi:hypothetical protein [Cryobacterium zhongshanensis]|uniref:Uncharacterized protein n=1 Tax=Cryobacterium zhongshanensis TaxID=2928153 RepID=A0AA41QT19_9MICO|nr:hypothetical protein [Cryobacterium zhongshanensis]MCI4656954.1 hypothetical protein [Cryobacterium zhongshanensis]